MDLSGEHGQGARKPQNAQEMDGESVGEEGSSPARRKWAKMARFGQLARGESRRRSGDGSQRLREWSGGEVKRNGGGGGRLGRGRSPLESEARGRGVGNVGSGSGGLRFC